MPTYQYTRAKKRRSGIRIKVCYNKKKSIKEESQASNQVQLVPIAGDQKSYRERKRNKKFEVPMEVAANKRPIRARKEILQLEYDFLRDRQVKELEEQLKLAKQEKDMETRAIRAREVKLRLEEKCAYKKEVCNLEAMVKRAKQESYDIRSSMKPKVFKGKTSEEKLCHVIEQACAELLPNKHCKAKATFVASALQSDGFLKGEFAAATFGQTKNFIRHCFALVGY
jgi:hypothetical protein